MTQELILSMPPASCGTVWVGAGEKAADGGGTGNGKRELHAELHVGAGVANDGIPVDGTIGRPDGGPVTAVLSLRPALQGSRMPCAASCPDQPVEKVCAGTSSDRDCDGGDSSEVGEVGCERCRCANNLWHSCAQADLGNSECPILGDKIWRNCAPWGECINFICGDTGCGTAGRP